ncbi:hypothetical protein GWI33_019982 [Rhynchophorus ferrugineus]|uniref:Uncharacterized protein n=1 Tax=Rhynchophorus ferrugineus TaxID=354439 RepID=A0A834HS89_RHYFE|nr:hypothetical protein GWI33_019982 [Rhynchophorus ferrugineus]
MKNLERKVLSGEIDKRLLVLREKFRASPPSPPRPKGSSEIYVLESGNAPPSRTDLETGHNFEENCNAPLMVIPARLTSKVYDLSQFFLRRKYELRPQLSVIFFFYGDEIANRVHRHHANKSDEK